MVTVYFSDRIASCALGDRRMLPRFLGWLFGILLTTISVVYADEPMTPFVRLASGVKGHVHPAICVTKSGDLIVVFSQSDFKDLRMTRSSDRGNTWSTPKPVPGTEQSTIYPGSLTTLRDGRIVHFWNTWYQDAGMATKSRYPEYSISSDGGKSWKPSVRLPKNPHSHSVIRHPFVELMDGTWLLTLTDKTIVYDAKTGLFKPFGDGRNHGLTPIVQPQMGTFVSGIGLRSHDAGKTWQSVPSFPRITKDGWRYDLVRLPDGALVASEVSGAGIGGNVWQFVLSTDAGKTWGHSDAVTFYKPGRPINGRACPKTVPIDPQTLGTVFYDYSGCEANPGTAGVFFFRTPIRALLR